MPDRILTSHAGSLPRPEDLIALNERRAEGDFTNEEEYLARLRAAVADVVARQRESGIDLVNDGEFSLSMGIGVFELLNADVESHSERHARSASPVLHRTRYAIILNAGMISLMPIADAEDRHPASNSPPSAAEAPSA